MSVTDLSSHDSAMTTPPRPTRQAMMRGARRRCPACGEGSMFSRYLSVTENCTNCHEALHHHRADDGPAYITIMIIAHLFVPLLMVSFILWRPPVAVMLIGFLVAAVSASLALLPTVKGAMVGVQWARRMHGFDAASRSASNDTQ